MANEQTAYNNFHVLSLDIVSGEKEMLAWGRAKGRTVELKKAFYKALAERLHQELGVRLEDVFINLVEVKKENWSFGNGIAQYAE